MKKPLLLPLLAMLFAVAACSKEPAGDIVAQPETAPAGEVMHFYGVKLSPETRGAAQHDRLWHNGTTVKVKFLNGSATMQATVEQIAHEWEQYANITFKFVDEGDAHIRVGFDWNANRWITWSYIGTDCKFERNQAEATMSFADFDYKSDAVIRGDILRAFGQALGLELESRNINFVPQWASNPARVANYWALDIEDVTWDILKQYVFDPLDADNAISTDEYDELSIMRWPFPANILLNGGDPIATSGNTELSDLDKAFVAELYPMPVEEDYLAKITFEGELSLGVAKENAVFIDWGNGVVEAVPSGDYIYVRHLVDTRAAPYRGEEISIILRGDAKALFAIRAPYYAKTLDISGCTHLSQLLCEYGSLTSLDLSNCPLLEYFSCFSNQLTSLDVSNNPLLNYIRIHVNPFIEDQAAVVAFANSLPDRTGMFTGILQSSVTHPEWIADICAAKNWRLH
jgi:hypothetical protein